MSKKQLRSINMVLLQPSTKTGYTIIELLVAMAIASLMLPALLTGLVSSREGKAQQTQRRQAVSLLQEAEEAARSYRNRGWDSFAVNGTYHPVVSGQDWTLVSGTESINGFTRSIVISDVYRDGTGAIVTTAGTLDPSTKLLTTTIAWSFPYTTSIQSSIYLTRYLDNLTFTHTTVADFKGVSGNVSNLQGTAITNTSGGEVVLGQGNANWCRPQDSILSTYTLPRQGNAISARAGATNGSANSVFIGMGDGTNGKTYQTYSVSDPPSPTPPVVSPSGAGYSSTYKTNAVANDGTYTYLAVNGTSKQVVILDTSYTVKSTINLPSNANANGIYVASSLLYVTSSNKIYVYNVSNPSSPQLKGTATIWDSNATALQVVYQASKLYVSMSGSITGLELFTVAGGGTSITPWSVAAVTWFQTPVGLAVNSTGSRAYIAFTASGAIKGGFYIVDTSTRWLGFYNPNLSTYNTDWDGNGTMNPLGMTIATANKAIIVGTGGSQQYQVVDISNDSPTHCGGLSISQGISAVTSIIQANGLVFAYAISGEANNQFKVIEGGSGGLYTTTGTFESSYYDTGTSSGFNRFTATINEPSQTSIKMQVAVAAAVNGSCSNATYSYVGPNGSTSAYFVPSGSTISGTIPFGSIGSYQNPNRCFRYKAFLNSNDNSQSPVLNDLTVNYSP